MIRTRLDARWEIKSCDSIIITNTIHIAGITYRQISMEIEYSCYGERVKVMSWGSRRYVSREPEIAKRI